MYDSIESQRLKNVVKLAIIKEIISHNEKVKHLGKKESENDELEYFSLCIMALLTVLAHCIANVGNVEDYLDKVQGDLKRCTWEYYELFEKHRNLN